MKWVKISERLPEKDMLCLWWRSEDNYCVCRWYYADTEEIQLDGATHWLGIAGPEDCCEWTYDDYHGYYDRICCSEPFGLSNDYPLTTNNIHHCPNCGRKIKEVKL